MQNLKYDKNEHIYETETDSQTFRKRTSDYQRGKGVGEGELDTGSQKVQTSSYKINKYSGCNIQHDKYN